jgi:hypothetical protein
VQHELENASTNANGDDGPLWSPTAHQRFKLACIAVLCVVLLVVLPPYISMNRYQRRVTTAIGGALGRPVHFDRISLHILPLPGLTIENFVVTESPEFGSEPVLRANVVEARVRLASLWRRRIEVSHISLDAPSINLVRRPDSGTWNLQSILMQASQINSAPTSAKAGTAPRFPYIEATDARINIKNGIDKLPFSVKEADFALWLPEPGEWRVRLAGKPVRTDTDVSDVGLLRVEATLGRANDLAAATIDLTADWKPTPLGEAAKLTVGYDLGWRGAASADASLHGTVGNAKLSADAHLRNLRRADFVPETTLDIDAHCEAITSGLLRALHDIRCAVPTSDEGSFSHVVDSLRGMPSASGSSDMPDSTARPGVLLIRGDLPNVLDLHTATGNVSLTDAPADYIVRWLRLFTQRVPPDLKMQGTLGLTAGIGVEGESPKSWFATATCICILPEPPRPKETKSGLLATKLPEATKPQNRWAIVISHAQILTTGRVQTVADDALSLSAYPAPDSIDAKNEPMVTRIPAASSVSGEVSRVGYLLRYGSAEAAAQVAAVLPPLGDDMPADVATGLESQRAWYGKQIWTAAPAAHSKPEPRRHHKH